MIEILWHGRGGQGAFTAARILGAAFVLDQQENSEEKGSGENSSADRYALAFPSFGPERRGAPIRAFTKLNDRPIGDRSEIRKADYSIFLDDTLFSDGSFQEIKEDGKIILNTKKKIQDPRIVALDGDAIAAETLKLPITNTIMLGALAAVLEQQRNSQKKKKTEDAVSEVDGSDNILLSLNAISQAIQENMPEKLHRKNIEAVRAAAAVIAAGEGTIPHGGAGQLPEKQK